MPLGEVAAISDIDGSPARGTGPLFAESNLFCAGPFDELPPAHGVAVYSHAPSVPPAPYVVPFTPLPPLS